MSVIHVDAQVSAEQLVKAMEQLPSHELQAFVNEVAALQARRGMQNQSARESELLVRIGQKLPVDLQLRFDELIEKRQAGDITEIELGELIAITDRSERLEADRIQSLVELAALKGTTLSSLMQELGIRTPHGQLKN